MYNLHYGHLQDCEIPFVMDAFALKNLNFDVSSFQRKFCVSTSCIYVCCSWDHARCPD